MKNKSEKSEKASFSFKVSTTMLSNKLSIDQVELKDKRVLIRLVNCVVRSEIDLTAPTLMSLCKKEKSRTRSV